LINERFYLSTLFPKIDVAAAYQHVLEIVDEYYKLSGIPTLINTSFNMHEEPIVSFPADAIRAFLQGNIDYLAIGSYLVKHPLLNA